jgi:ssDNA-specific exonuclease RecJ
MAIDKDGYEGQWYTIHGSRVFIRSGESANDAINRKIGNKTNTAKSNHDEKERQIKANQQEASRLNTQEAPRRLPLKDIPAEVANTSSDVLNLRTKQRFYFAKGTKIKRCIVFAGKGCSKEFRDAEKYYLRYHKRYPSTGEKEDWQHCAGFATITNGRITVNREVHWVQGKDGKVREAFIKFHEN